MKTLDNKEYLIVLEIINRVLNAYDNEGKLTEDYSANIILENLSQTEISFLKDF